MAAGANTAAVPIMAIRMVGQPWHKRLELMSDVDGWLAITTDVYRRFEACKTRSRVQEVMSEQTGT
jgi:hypothetical protein